MNKNTLFLIASASLLLLSGCAKEPAGGGEGLRIQVEPSVAEATKASLTAESLADFYLRVVSDDSAYSYFVHLSKDGSGAWVSPTQLLWKNASASVDYTAARFGTYAFTAANFASGVSVALTLPADQSTQERLDAADLLTAKTVTKAYSATTAGALPVAFSHALAKVRFTLTLGEDFYKKGFGRAENPVKDFTVKGANGGFSFTPSTGEVTAGDAPEDIVPLAGTFTPGTASAKSATASYEAILVPQTYPAGTLKVSFSVGDYEYEWTNAESFNLLGGLDHELPLSATTAPPPPGLEAIDLGLSVKWASFNVGATAPEDYGDHFAWGETKTKDFYHWMTLKYCGDTTGKKFSKYVPSDKAENWGGEGSPDNRTVLEAEDDAATANWGAPWRTPTDDEWTELLTLDKHWVENYNGSGINGYTFTGNGNTIFLPAAGRRYTTNFDFAGSVGDYWSSSLNTDNPSHAWIEYFDSGKIKRSDGIRSNGQSVRPVTE